MKYTLVLIIWLLSFLSAFSQQQPASGPPQATPQQIDDLVRANKLLQEDFGRMQTAYKDLKNDHDELQEKVKGYEPLLNNWGWMLGGFGGSCALAFLLLWFVKIPKLIRETSAKIEKRIDSEIDSVFTDRRDQFMALIKEYSHDEMAKKKHKLVMLTHPTCTDEFHLTVLKRHGFNVTAYTNVEQLSDATIEQQDIVIINNEGGQWRSDEIETFIAACGNICVYVGRGQINTPGEIANRFAAANVRGNFVANVLNTLKYN